MTKLTFKELYSATKEAIHATKEPIVRRRNERAIQSAIDSAQSQAMEAEEKLEKELSVVTEGKTVNLNEILALRQVITDAEATVTELEKFKAEFMA